MNRDIEDGMGFAGFAPPTKREREAEFRKLLQTEISYLGFAYNVRSQFGIDSLKKAIKANGDE